MLGKRVQREESPLYPEGLALKRMRAWPWARMAEASNRRGEGAGDKGGWRGRQSNDKWSMPGFSVDPSGAALVAGRYTVEAVRSQVVL